MKATSILLSLCFAIVASASRAQLENENLLAKLPAGFKIDFQDKNKNMLINEMVPEKETVNNWTEMVTVQVFYNLKATPDQFKAKMEAGMSAACPGSESHPVAQGDENGYPSVVWLQSCPLNKATGKPEITWIKGIQGNDSFYVAQLAFKAWPSKEQITDWMQVSAQRRRVRYAAARAILRQRADLERARRWRRATPALVSRFRSSPHLAARSTRTSESKGHCARFRSS